MSKFMVAVVVCGMFLGMSQGASAEVLSGKKVGKRYFPLVSNVFDKTVKFELGAETSLVPLYVPVEATGRAARDIRDQIETKNSRGKAQVDCIG